MRIGAEEGAAVDGREVAGIRVDGSSEWGAAVLTSGSPTAPVAGKQSGSSVKIGNVVTQLQTDPQAIVDGKGRAVRGTKQSDKAVHIPHTSGV